MTEIIKIGMFGIAGVLIAIQFRGQKPEYGVYIGLAIAIVIFCYALDEFQALLSQFDLIKKYLGAGEQYLSILLKVMGITYICEFSSGICKDAGYGSIADQLEIVGKLAVMFAGFPILLAVLKVLEAVRL